jgi:hypothetical protein
LTDAISLGVLARIVHRDIIDDTLAETGKREQRNRKLPAHVVVYFVLAMALFRENYEETIRLLVNGLKGLGNWTKAWSVPTTGAISKARDRLGEDPLRVLYEKLAVPLAKPGAPGAWLRGRRLMAIDAVRIDIPDTAENLTDYEKADSRSPFPQVHVVGLGECGTRAIIAAEIGSVRTGEQTLAVGLGPLVEDDMLVLADRGFYSYSLWQRFASAGADLLWRVKKDLKLPVLETLPDGSYRSVVRSKTTQHKNAFNIPLSAVSDPMLATSLPVRVIEYRVTDSDDTDTIRLITTILDPLDISAPELAAVYHHRWEFEHSLREVETTLLQPGQGLRSKKPELVRQELWALLLAHYATRALIVEAADTVDIDPDQLSFIRTLRIIRRQITNQAAFSPHQT